MSTRDMSARPLSALCFAAASLLLPAFARAQVSTAPELPTSTRMMALGGNAQALAQSTSGVFSNPAAMSLGRVYHVDSLTLYDPTVGRWMFGGSVADTTRMVSAGLAYNYSLVDGQSGVRNHHDVRVGLSVLLTEGIALGLTGRYMNLGGPVSNGQRLGTDFAGVTFDAGAVVRPVSFLTLAVTGYSLTNPDTALSPLSIGGGIALTPIEALSIVGDTVWDLRSYAEPRMRMSGGVEFMLDKIPLRAGYLYDDTRFKGGVHTVTAGVGYIDRLFGAEFSMRQDVAGSAMPQTTLMLNLRYFYNPSAS
jgi:hypothetical protein